MKTMNPNIFNRAESWERPTVREVERTLEQIGIPKNCYVALLGWSRRAVTSWYQLSKTAPETPSKIPYLNWCILARMAYKIDIYGEPLKVNLEDYGIDYSLNCPLYCYQPVGEEILKRLISKQSPFPFPRDKLARMFDLNPVKFASSMNHNQISYGTWLVLMMLCGQPLEYIFHRNIWISFEGFLESLKCLSADEAKLYAKAYTTYYGGTVTLSKRVNGTVTLLRVQNETFEIFSEDNQFRFHKR